MSPDIISLVKVDQKCHMGGGGVLKSAEKVSRIIWMAPKLTLFRKKYDRFQFSRLPGECWAQHCSGIRQLILCLPLRHRALPQPGIHPCISRHDSQKRESPEE